MKRLLVLFLWVWIGSLGFSACPRPITASPAKGERFPRPPDRREMPPPPARLDRSEPSGPRYPRECGCTEGPALTLMLDGSRPAQRLGQALRQHLWPDLGPLERVGPGRPADLYIGYDPPPDFHTYPLTPTRFVPVVSFWLPVTEVTYADLERIFRGEVRDWAALGAPEPQAIVRLAVRTDPPAPLLPFVGSRLPNVNALVAALERIPGGITLLPLEQVDVRLHVLRVDGHDPLREDVVRPGAPLVRTLAVAVSPHLPPEVAQRVEDFVRRQRLAPLPPATEIAIVGDVMPARLVELHIRSQGSDYSRPFADVAPILQQADLAIANLEGALSDAIAPPADPHTMLFLGSGCFAEGMREAGVDAVSLANNHSLNFGAAGLSDTLALLGGVGIVPFGAGMNLAEARRPALFTVRGTTLAFLGYDAVSDSYAAGDDRAGTVPADAALIAEDIAAARRQADVVILYFHWGWEYTHDPSPAQRLLAHQAIEAGADVVVGSHPHWVQGLERYRGRPIVYSLGNFVFDQLWSGETRQGLIAHLVFRGNRLVNLRLQAVQIEDDCRPVLLPTSDAEEVYQQVRQASPHWPDQKGEKP